MENDSQHIALETSAVNIDRDGEDAEEEEEDETVFGGNSIMNGDGGDGGHVKILNQGSIKIKYMSTPNSSRLTPAHHKSETEDSINDRK